MKSETDEVVCDLPAHFGVYKSGRVERLHQPVFVPAGIDDVSGVACKNQQCSKDVVLDAGTGLSVRLFLPKLQQQPSSSKKLPVLVYFHGGAFIVESARSTLYHNYVASLAAAAGVLAVSVDYRLAPEHPLPAAYDDCWTALRWASSSSAQDSWLTDHRDASSLRATAPAANIVHNLLLRASCDSGTEIEGAVLLHPFFVGSTAVEGESERAVAITAKLWAFACPDAAGGADDPWINPIAPERLGCKRMLVCAAEMDWLAARDRAYYEAVAASGWSGSAAWLESEGVGHVFFLLKPEEREKAKQLMDRVVAFIAGS